LDRRHVLRGLEHRAPARIASAILLAGDRGAGQQIVAVDLALLGARPEDAVGVKALSAVRMLRVARPLNARAAGQLRVAQARVVARLALRAALPVLEGAFRIVPLDEGRAVLVAEVHAPRVREE